MDAPLPDAVTGATPVGGDGAPLVAPAAGAVEEALVRVARAAAWTFGVPFAQVVRFGPGPPVSHGTLAGSVPDLRAVAARLPTGADLVVVEDAARDARFEHVLPPEARFFAWAVVSTDAALGALALLDVRPHPAAPADHLLDLAALAADLLRSASAEARVAAFETRWAEAEARFQALGELTSDAVVIADADGCVLDANDHAAVLLGCDGPEVLIGRPLADLARGDGAATGVQADERTFPYEGRPLRLAVLRQPG